jgi:hypothetical protein
MSLPETHKITLRFKIDGDAPKEYIDRWLELKTNCENSTKTSSNKQIVIEWLQNCTLESVKKLPYLNRCEGGIGGDSNLKNKQMRFRDGILKLSKIDKDNDILLDEVDSTDEEKWTLEELDDLIRGFRRFANKRVKADCVKGYIEIVNKKSFHDNYLDNKDDY